MYLMIDNYDSFTYNLKALFNNCGADVKVIKNDEYISAEGFEGIIISPGPSSPSESGSSMRYLKEYTGKIPVFGVCLGMQCIGYSCGHNIIQANSIRHGKLDTVVHNGESVLLKGVPSKFRAVRYHSLAVSARGPAVTSYSESDSTPMSFEDLENKLFGVQFHPESVLSEYGDTIVKNFMAFCGRERYEMDTIIRRVNSGEELPYDDALAMFGAMADGEMTDAQIASVLMSLRYRGETPFELAALLSALNRRKNRLTHTLKKTIDTCGTGGDGKSTVNVSTAVGIILASMGYGVVKHGNSAQSGKVGSADILQKLGFDMDYTGSSPEDFLAKNNFVFMFAPRYHPSLKGIGKVRREIKVPTIFNYAGPLLNPAEPEFQVIGINKRENLDLAANAARICGRSGITFYSSFDGYDEVSSNGFTECLSVEGDHIDRFVIDPSKFFAPFEMPAVDSLETAEHLLVSGLSGADEQIAKIFAINTALALKTMKENDLEAGYSRALSHILSGAPMIKLKAMTGVV